MAKQILTDHENTNDELLQLISTITPEQFNVVPFEGSWTAGQLAEHLHKSDVMIVRTMNGAVTKTSRQPDEHIKTIKDLFLDFNSKMKSPDFNTPSDNMHDHGKLFNSLKEKKDKITEVIKTKDLTETCEGFEVPGIGKLTRLEWIYFDIYHKQRHTHQLKNIFQKLKQQSSFDNAKHLD